MKGHHSFSNTRRLLNVIHSEFHLDATEVVISLAEKPFKRVERGYLYAVVKVFSLLFSRQSALYKN